MDYTKPIKLGIADKLKADEVYRKAFFRAYATDSIALQIRELRKLRENMTQVELAESCGMKQSAVSRIEQAEYSSWTFNTLCRVAEALKARLIVTFQPMEEAIRDYEVREAFSMQDGSAAVSVRTVALPADWNQFKVSNLLTSGVNAWSISINSTPIANSEKHSIRFDRVKVVDQETEVSHG